MSDNWKVHLVYTEDKSNKFWRARTKGSTLYINWGRIGTAGQTQEKEFDSPAEATASLEKQADGKRRKGYVDEGGASAAPAAKPAAPPRPSKPENVKLTLEQGGRSIEVELRYDGKTVRTSVSETFVSADDAAAAFVRIHQAMLADGYKPS